jgi:hypothetical protein
MEARVYVRIIRHLKRKRGVLTFEMIEDAYDKYDVDADVEIDIAAVFRDVADYKLDEEKEAVRLAERRFKKMERQAASLSEENSSDGLNTLCSNVYDENEKKRNEALIDHISGILARE